MDEPRRRDRTSVDLVTTARELAFNGVARSQLAAELGAGRWRRWGHAIVLHNGPLSPVQRRRVARIHAGPGALLTAFTAGEVFGLSGWSRPQVHVLAAAGTRMRQGCPVPVVLHLRGAAPRLARGGGIERVEDALVRAASTFAGPRPACAILAAAVQQDVTPVAAVFEAVDRATRVRHRSALRAAVGDIAGGSQALSEIDFVRLCRRFGLPEPQRQTVRVDSQGRRRYLDATWRRADGRLVVVEVDGALHLQVRRWWDDQLRQNELSLADALVLRYPTVVVRAEDVRVASQLRRALT